MMANHFPLILAAASLFWSLCAYWAGWPLGFLYAWQALALWWARRDAVRHWLVPALALGQAVTFWWFLPPALALPALAWLLPFGAILRQAYRKERDVEAVVRLAAIGSLRDRFVGIRTQHGQPLNALTESTPALLIFLRHSGCAFCRQTLADVARVHGELSARGVAVVLIHQSSDESMDSLLQHYGIAHLPVVHDPDRRLYRHFGLERGSWWQVANPWVVMKTAYAAFWQGHGMRRPDGDPLQMPGIFVLRSQRLLSGYFHRQSSERPDLIQLSSRLF